MTQDHHTPSRFQLLPEWAEQEAVVLVWPDEQTDWADTLDDIRRTYVEFIEAIARFESVVLVVRNISEAETWLLPWLSTVAKEALQMIQADYDDTWARDTMPLTCADARGELQMMDFRFNGWGCKFESTHDNLLGRRLHRQGIFRCTIEQEDNFILEGGSVETDGEGNLLTTSVCLLAPHRNQPLTREQIERRLCDTLGMKRVLWIDHGNLAGDDTDGHIDTLVRCAPHHTLLYVGCDDTTDPQYADLHAMEQDLLALNDKADMPYRLLRLPMPDALMDEDGCRMPATYANFLVINGAVIVPTYGQPQHDQEALRTVAEAFPDREIIGVDAQAVIRQHGSLHCLSMQLPKGVGNSVATAEEEV